MDGAALTHNASGQPGGVTCVALFGESARMSGALSGLVRDDAGHWVPFLNGASWRTGTLTAQSEMRDELSEDWSSGDKIGDQEANLHLPGRESFHSIQINSSETR